CRPGHSARPAARPRLAAEGDGAARADAAHGRDDPGERTRHRAAGGRAPGRVRGLPVPVAGSVMNRLPMVLALLVLLAPPAACAQPAQDGWSFAVTPYLWLPNVNGTLKYRPPPDTSGAPDVQTGPNNYLENLSLALMLAGEARKGPWSVVTDLVYLDFD